MTSSEPYIVGFSDSVHDRSVCLFRGAEPLFAIEEERLTREKHGVDFRGFDLHDPAVFSKLSLDHGTGAEHEAKLRPLVDYCLAAAGIDESQVSTWIGNSLHTAFPFSDRALFVNHHRAHAASTYFSSGYDSAAVLVMDGYGDALSGDSYETTSLYAAEGSELAVKLRVDGRKRGLHLANSAGILYRMGTLLAGFGIMDEGKMMGLAAYGNPHFLPLIREYMNFSGDAVQIDNEAIWTAFQPISILENSFSHRADIAASFQGALESVMLHYATVAKKLTGARRLCIAGGVGLNCVANQKILEKGLFDEIHVFPAPADNGVSFGSAYLAAHTIHKLPRTGPLERAAFGKTYSADEIDAALARHRDAIVVEKVSDADFIGRVAQAIEQHRLVMWFASGSEFGPRALGFRSILGDPRDTTIRDYINAAVKSRESFRPLAPMVLEAECERWFDCRRSPFMLFSPPAKAITRERAPAIVHVDGTTRLQTVSPANNAKIHQLLTQFHANTGVPILLNTSFNTQTEPIVESPDDALKTFLGSPVEVLCIGGFLVRKSASERGAT